MSSRSRITCTQDDARTASSQPWRVGDLLFTWFRIEAVRSGGMGHVYLCRHVEEHSGYALKTVKASPLVDPPVRDLMQREAESWLRVEPHPNVVTCHHLMTDVNDKRLWLFLERIDGQPSRGNTLRDWMHGPPMNEVESLRLLSGICAGMRHVERHGLVHGDLKPANVLIDADGIAKVADLGLARPFRLLEEGEEAFLAGTPSYMAPEAWDGARSSSRDVYAFGILMWEMLTGEHPFARERNMRAAHQRVEPQDPRQSNPLASAALSEIAMACLVKDAAARPSFATIADGLGHAGANPADFNQQSASVPVGYLCNQATSLLSLGLFEDAEQRARQALALAPANFNAHETFVRVCVERGAVAAAHESMTFIGNATVTQPAQLYAQSRILRVMGRLDDALDAICKAIEQEPHAALYLAEKGRILARSGRTGDALYTWEKAAASKTEAGSDALRCMAQVIGSTGRVKEAETLLQMALARNPRDERAMSALARLRAGIDPVEALELVRQALSVNPSDAEAHRLRAELLGETGKNQEAESLLREYLKKQPDDVFALHQLGMLLVKSDRAEEGLRVLEQMVSVTPRASWQSGMQGALLGTMFGRWDAARRKAEVAIEMDPSNPEPWNLLADACLHLDDMAGAVDACRRGLAVAAAYERLQRKHDAVEQLVAGHRLMPERAFEALQCFIRAESIVPRMPSARIARVHALDKLERQGEALPVLDSLMQDMGTATPAIVLWMKLRCFVALGLSYEARPIAEQLSTMVGEEQRQQLQRFLDPSLKPLAPHDQLAWSWHMKAIEAQKQNQFDAAVEFMHRARYIEPRNPTHTSGLALARVCAAPDDAAIVDTSIKMFDAALAATNRDSTLLFNYGQMLTIAQRWDAARPIAEELMRATPDDPLVQELKRRVDAHVPH